MRNNEEEDEKEALKDALKAFGLKEKEMDELLGSPKKEDVSCDPPPKKERSSRKGKSKKPSRQRTMEPSLQTFSKKIEKEKSDKQDYLVSASEVQPLMLAVTLNPILDEEIINHLQENIPTGQRAKWVKQALKTAAKLEASGGLGAGADQMIIQSFMGQFASMMQGFQGTPGGRPQGSTHRTGQSGAPPRLRKMEGKPEDYKPDRPPLDDAMDSVIVG
ncbi:MAG: hypothetical protein GF308_06805 [Candidatus Heimdallarchaeota archaeon]|nr:hypothetical protein [Candidatus Heimdallarchaeota archaeon]